MEIFDPFRTRVLAALLISSWAIPGAAQSKSDAAGTPSKETADADDGQHDFDFEFGVGKFILNGCCSR